MKTSPQGSVVHAEGDHKNHVINIQGNHLEGIQRTLETQGADITRLRQRRDSTEHGPLILRRLTELERDRRFDADFNRDIATGPVRPRGVVLLLDVNR